MVARCDDRLDASDLLKRLDQLRRDLRGVDRLAGGTDGGVGDDVDGVELVGVALRAVACIDIVDEAFVKGPGVHTALPLVDNRIAEAVRLGLLVGHAGR